MGDGRGIALGIAVVLGCGFDTSGLGSGDEAPASSTPAETTGDAVTTDVVEVTSVADTSETATTAATPTTTDAITSSLTSTGTSDPATDSGGTGEWSEASVLTISAAAQELTAPVELVPVLVRLNAKRIDYQAAQEGGLDLRFIDNATSTQLPHEIDRWSPGGNSTVWVRVPMIDPTESRVITMEYGNPLARDQQNAVGVWAQEFVAVWHMDDGCDGRDGDDMLDSTGKGRHARCVGLQSANVGAGRIGDAVLYEDVAQTLDVRHDAAFNFQAEYTLEAWVLIEQAVLDAGDLDRVAIERFETYRLLATRVDGNHGVRFRSWFDDGEVTNDANPVGAGWHYYVGASIEGDESCLFVDGVDRGCRAARDNIIATMVDLRIGGGLEGQIDEVRISAVRRSDDWVKLQYASVEDALITY